MAAIPTFALVMVAGYVPEVVADVGATGDDVVLEIVRTVGIIVSAIAACYCARVAAQGHRVARRVERKVDRKREQVRRVDDVTGAKIVIEEGDRNRQNPR